MKHFRLYLAPLLLLLLLLLARLTSQAQSVGIGTATPLAGAALEIRASDKGLLIPRLTATQRAGIAAPPQGLMVYQTDGSAGGGPGTGFWYFGGNPAAWVFINPAGGAGDNLGNHTATQNLNLQANALVGTGASLGTAVGVGVRADGGLNIGQNGVGNNVLLGYQAGQSLTPNVSSTLGLRNQFSGYQSGRATTTGINNQFDGYQSGYSNTTGNANYFGGFSSGYRNTTGSDNQFVGFFSGLNNTTGSSNQFSGYWSGYNNTTGSFNKFSGAFSGFTNQTGSYNQFDGYESGLRNTTGTLNHFSGYRSGTNNTTGSSNYFSGFQSGSSNITGSGHQFSGRNSGFANTTGNYNTFNGFQSGGNNTTGSNNQFSGRNSGFDNTTGDFNTFNGSQSGRYNTTGDNNTALGNGSGPAQGSGGISNATALGANVRLTQSNTLVLGNNANVGIGTSSPQTRLSLSPTTIETKITLWDGGSAANHYGFGISGGQLNYHAFDNNASHVFYVGGKNGDGLELMRIQGNRRVGIGTNDPQNELDVNGTARVAELHTRSTGGANMVPVAYGRIRGSNGTTAAGTGNFTCSKNTFPLSYTVRFTSGLSSTLFSNYIVLVTTNDGNTGATVDTNTIGKLTVTFPTLGVLGGSVSNDFSFIVYVP